jgi:hypothetical protein
MSALAFALRCNLFFVRSSVYNSLVDQSCKRAEIFQERGYTFFVKNYLIHMLEGQGVAYGLHHQVRMIGSSP